MVGYDEDSEREPHYSSRKAIRDRLVALADGREVTLRSNDSESKGTLSHRQIHRKEMGIYIVETGNQLPIGQVRDAYVDTRVVELKQSYFSQKGVAQ